MIDHNYKPGIGIGRGRASLKTSVVNRIPTLDDGVVNIQTPIDETYIQFTNQNEKTTVRTPKVTYIPNDDFDDYKLHVISGKNFEKYEEVKVKVTGENVPPYISNLTDMHISTFLILNVIKMGFKSLTPIQKYAIPIIAESRDIMACAETGSGKTAAFLIPILNSIFKLKDVSESSKSSPYSVVITPTRELCRQIFTVAVELSKSSSIRCSYGYGGVDMFTSLKNLRNCDILFSTPGRLVNYLNDGLLSLDRLKYLVLDEADKLLVVDTFQESVNIVLKNAKLLNNCDFQISMFSATLPYDVQRMAQDILKADYLFVAVGYFGGANNDISQTLIPVTGENKLDVALDYISNHQLGKMMVFVQRKRMADFYGIRLIEMGMTVATIHGDRCQEAREQALNDFKSGRVNVLVATDVASRGLDIPLVDTVVNIDMPSMADLYVHRIGRSGRCGNPGKAVSFFDPAVDSHLVPRLIQIIQGSGQTCPAFLSQLGSSTKANVDYTRDLRPSLVPAASLCNFMNMNDGDSSENDDDIE